ncbi:MAG: hypothetical protein GWN71_42500, partial [Gammaproteobacteria bacterium]|nr:hypothetical protein [Gemmatimonadota bacterium]NIU79973.1 hypothetical protein [Gammaproteobacteria bacterium]
PELAALLRESAVGVTAEQYERADERAIEAQRQFLKTSGRARAAVFWAGVATAGILVVGALAQGLPEGLENILLLVLASGGAVAGGLAGVWIQVIGRDKLLETWMRYRAEAETLRLRYFEQVTRDSELSEPLLQLEYFRRYQLDVQRAFYGVRADEHRDATERATRASTLATGVGAVATGLAGALGAALSAAWSALAGLGFAGQAVSARYDNREATTQSRRNAERYERTRKILDRLYAKLDEVRSGTAQGELAIMHEFVAAVHEQLSVEHREWLDEMGSAGEAVRRLEDLLASYREQQGVN